MTLINYAFLPPAWDGCFQSFTESLEVQTIRTQMDDGLPKVRRRFTHALKKAAGTVTLPANAYQPMTDFFVFDTMGGVLPFFIKTPRGESELWRFSGYPSFNWISNKYFILTMELEQLPTWGDERP